MISIINIIISNFNITIDNYIKSDIGLVHLFPHILCLGITPCSHVLCVISYTIGLTVLFYIVRHNIRDQMKVPTIIICIR